MSKKDNGLSAALAFIMHGETETGPQDGHVIATKGTQKGHESTTKVPQATPRRPGKEKLVNHHIGLYPSDWKALERMAAAEGGNVAILIRRAIREMLSRTSFRE